MIRRCYTAVILFLISLGIMFSTGCATAPVSEGRVTDGPIAHKPTMVVGDKWVFSGWSRTYGTDMYTSQIMEVKPDGSYVVETECEKAKRAFLKYFNNEFQLVKMIHKVSGKAIPVAVPPLRELSFPLFVGKKWSGEETYHRARDGKYYHFRYTYIIKDYETVTTPAGPLQAFKILKKHHNLDKDITGVMKYWYSPEAKVVVKEKARGKRGRLLISYQLAAPDSTPPTIKITSPIMERGIAMSKTTKQTEIQGLVTDESGVKWFTINGNRVSPSENGEFSYRASLSEGVNRFELKASDVRGNEARKIVTITYTAPKSLPAFAGKTGAPSTKPACWVLSVGISNYENERLSLRYAAHDARAIADILRGQEGKLFSEVSVKTLINHQCARAAIMEGLTSHLGMAAPDDVVFIFIAGHGVRHKQTGSYYFLTYNADVNNLMYEGLKWSDFEEAINIMSKNVNKVVLVLDTCHAGAMKAYLRGVEGGEDLALTLKQATGLYILASSKAGEESIEGEHFKLPGEKKGHGAFTYALLKGLSGEANFDGDSYISVHELFKYVAKHVPRITKGHQHPYSRTAGTDMPIATVSNW
jgi:hypothetical protein